MKKLFRIILNLIFPPRCACCRELLPVFEEKYGAGLCLCKICYASWEWAKGESCPECLCPSHKCLCTVDTGSLKKTQIPKLLTYSPNVNNTQNKMIFSLKKKNDKRIAEFMASELSVSIGRFCVDNKIIPDECIYTYIPRRKRSVGEFGFDQGERLSLKVARLFEGEFLSLFSRVGGREQKKLDKAARQKNINRTLKLKKSAAKRIKGRTVIVIDDLVTTGSTLDGAIRLLKSAGAGEIFVSCIARTCDKKSKK